MTTDDNPYASPAAGIIDDCNSHRGTLPSIKHPYVSAHGRATLTVVLLSLCVLLAGIAVYYHFLVLQMLNRVDLGELAPDIEDWRLSRYVPLMLANIGCQAVASVMFLIWFHRAHCNLPALRAEFLDYTPFWSVAWWFIPIVNFVRPYQVMREIYRESDPARIAPFGTPASGSLVGWWWGAWLAYTFFGRICLFLTVDMGGTPEVIARAAVNAMIYSFTVVSGILAIMLVRRIDRWQTLRHRKLQLLSTEFET